MGTHAPASHPKASKLRRKMRWEGTYWPGYVAAAVPYGRVVMLGLLGWVSGAATAAQLGLPPGITEAAGAACATTGSTLWFWIRHRHLAATTAASTLVRDYVHHHLVRSSRLARPGFADKERVALGRTLTWQLSAATEMAELADSPQAHSQLLSIAVEAAGLDQDALEELSGQFEQVIDELFGRAHSHLAAQIQQVRAHVASYTGAIDDVQQVDVTTPATALSDSAVLTARETEQAIADAPQQLQQLHGTAVSLWQHARKLRRLFTSADAAQAGTLLAAGHAADLEEHAHGVAVSVARAAITLAGIRRRSPAAARTEQLLELLEQERHVTAELDGATGTQLWRTNTPALDTAHEPRRQSS